MTPPSHGFQLQGRREDLSPRPTKRRNSGPSMEQTPPRRPFPCMPLLSDTLPMMQTKRARLSPRRKTPPAPRPRLSSYYKSLAAPLPLASDNPELFLPSLDTRPLPVAFAARLQPRTAKLLPALPLFPTTTIMTTADPFVVARNDDTAATTEEEDDVAKAWPEGKTVPTPFVRKLAKSRSAHALCA